MAHELPGTTLSGHHHITIGVSNPQEDFDFHTKVLGLKCVKRTLFYDGDVPIYHLYYGNDVGLESSLLTTFPLSHLGVKGKHGSGQVATVSLSVPEDALGYWSDRLKEHGMEVTENERFGEKHLDFVSPHNINMSLAGVAEDGREPYSNGPVPAEMMIRGTHSAGISTRDMEFMAEFMEIGWGSRVEAEENNQVRYAMGEGGSGTYTDFFIEPERSSGSWTVGEGAIHHMAYNVPNLEAQMKIKKFLEGIGYTDCSDVKDRGYFDSVYVRTPSGALFEACCSHDPSFQCDEPIESLGTQLMMSPQVKKNVEETLSIIGKIDG
ncbi:MAG: VOC family protein [Gammaproteobacteria bacterium]|nr:VOC family protein [Gammaproteobacteria bacterium]